MRNATPVPCGIACRRCWRAASSVGVAIWLCLGPVFSNPTEPQYASAQELTPSTTVNSDAATAASELSLAKLTQLGNSGVWLCADERRMRHDFTRLPMLRQQIESLQKNLATIVQSNAVLWAESQGTAPRAVDPARIGDSPAVRERVVRLTNLRVQLSMTLARIRRTSSAMAVTYERLSTNKSIQSSLGRLGTDQRLGPAGNYDQELKGLRDYFPVAETDWVPAYWQGPHLRLTGICNELAPATFTWSPELKQVLLTNGSWQAGGLPLPRAGRRRFNYQGQVISIQSVRLPYLQFGKCLLRDVPAFLLPPEFEHLGNRIGPTCFEGWEATPDPSRLRVALRIRD